MGEAKLAPGSRMGAYRLASPLGSGGMGEVWRALKLGPHGFGWSRQVALKIILPMFARDPQFRERFIAEARIAASLVHPNIVAVTDFGVSGETLWLEQELVDGTDGARLVDGAPSGLPAPLAVYIVGEALKGLAHAHAHETTLGGIGCIIHRDIKPSNLLVSRHGNVKLTDFGIAKVVRGDPSLTEIKGTIGYISPELLEGKGPTERSDLFAMGLVLWELLTGRKLFIGENEAERLYRTFECFVPPLAQVGVAAPPEVEAVLRRLLARSPADRYQSAPEALVALLDTPLGRVATSVDLKAFLPSVGVRPRSVSIPPSATSATPMAPAEGAVARTAEPPPPARRWPVVVALATIAVLSAGVTLAVSGDGRAVVVVPDASPVAVATPPPARVVPDAGVSISSNPPEPLPTTTVGSRGTERAAPRKRPRTRSAADQLMEPE